MPENTNKVFGIGFHKTGTSSLGAALTILGYRVYEAVQVPNILEHRNPIPYLLPYLEKYDAFEDMPWAVLYKELDKLYPDSKFILTTRQIDSWMYSAENQFRINIWTPMREYVYGHGTWNAKIYRQRYLQHHKEVTEYFKNRPRDLLVMNIIDGEDWRTLCPFLGHDLVDQPFPHKNPTRKWVI